MAALSPAESLFPLEPNRTPAPIAKCWGQTTRARNAPMLVTGVEERPRLAGTL